MAKRKALKERRIIVPLTEKDFLQLDELARKARSNRAEVLRQCYQEGLKRVSDAIGILDLRRKALAEDLAWAAEKGLQAPRVDVVRARALGIKLKKWPKTYQPNSFIRQAYDSQAEEDAQARSPENEAIGKAILGEK